MEERKDRGLGVPPHLSPIIGLEKTEKKKKAVQTDREEKVSQGQMER